MIEGPEDKSKRYVVNLWHLAIGAILFLAAAILSVAEILVRVSAPRL